MSEWAKKKCVPCTRDMNPLEGEELKKHLDLLEDGWDLLDERKLIKSYTFKNFKEALAFTIDVGKVAEEEGHHPNILLSWGEVVIELFTHKINGLSENDFILAAKCDVAYTSMTK